MDQRQLQIVLKLQDEATKELQKLSGEINNVEKNTKSLTGSTSTLSTVLKTGLAVGVSAFAALGATIFSSVKAAGEAEVKMASFDATMKSIVGSTIQLNTGMVQTISKMKVTGVQAEGIRNSISSAEIAIKEKTASLEKMRKELKAGKISQADFKLGEDRIQNSISGLNIKIREANQALGAHETSTVSVTQSIKMNAEAVEKARKVLIDAGSATRKLGFDNEEATVVLGRFFQATGDTKKAIELNNLAMDLARAKNLDLATAANLVNQVLAGNGRVLKQYQIDISDTASPLEALGLLHDKTKGQAEAFAKTYQGQMQILNESISDVKETIGTLFLPMINQMLKQITPAVQSTEEWINSLGGLDGITKTVKDSWANFLNVIETKTGLITDLQNAWDSIVTVFNTQLKPALEDLYNQIVIMKPYWEFLAQVIGIILVISIKALIIVVMALVTGFMQLFTWITNIQTFLMGSFYAAFNSIKSVIVTVTDAVNTLIQSFRTALDLASRVTGSFGVGKMVTSALSFLPGRANGGPVSSGSPYIVGERGPELFVPRSSGNIIPNGATGGGVVVNVYGDVSGSELVTKVQDAIMQNLFVNTKLSLT